MCDVHRHARGSSRGRLAGIQSPSPSPTLLTHSHNLAIYTSIHSFRAVAPLRRCALLIDPNFSVGP
eukprot:scaffold12569_cov181-Isochrysis_galbana.AAC.3